jgi:imidazolonepropionase-like amidohydrolase
VFYCYSALCFANPTALKAGHYLDVTTGKWHQDKIILIDDKGQIEAIGSTVPEGARLIDLSDKYLLPGLMDMHTHLLANLDKTYFAGLLQSPHRATIGGVVNAKITLEAGFTAVRNVGAYDFQDVALRNAINAGEVPGPRMAVSGPSLGITGGHCDNNVFNHSYDIQAQGVANGPWAVRERVRKNAKYGVDLIKFCATGGVFSKGTKVGLRQYTLEEMQAIVGEAHDRGLTVAAHAHGTEGIAFAIKAGVDSIEHASFLDKKTARLAKKHGTYLSMDIYNTDYTTSHGKKNGVPEENLKKDRETGERQRQSFALAVKEGVKLVYGTDAGIYPPGDNAKQFAIMTRYGMTPLQAIQSATVNAAHLLGWQDRVGQIKAGFAADLIAVDANPLESINVLEEVSFVMKDGEVYKNDKLKQ